MESFFDNSSDNPISDSADDQFGYLRLATVIADYLNNDLVSNSQVLAITGSWGSGKSSLMNLVEGRIRSTSGPRAICPIVINFNPWYFNSVEDLIRAFFGAIGRELLDSTSEPNAAELAKSTIHHLANLSQVVLGIMSEAEVPLAGKGKRIAGLLSRWSKKSQQNEPTSVDQLRIRISGLLERINKRVFVFIDDIDRLELGPLLQLLKLLRLTGSLTNITYIVAYDKTVVSTVIEREYGLSGEDYMAKICQAEFPVPPVNEFRRRHAIAAIWHDITYKTDAPDQSERFWEIYQRGLSRLFATPRDINRWRLNLALVTPLIQGEVNSADFASLEALRIHRYPVYSKLRDSRQILVGPQNLLSAKAETGDTELQSELNRLQEYFTDSGDYVDRIIRTLFPAYSSTPGEERYSSTLSENARINKQISSLLFVDRYFELGVDQSDIRESEISDFIQADRPAQIEIIDEFSSGDKYWRFLTKLEDHLKYLNESTAHQLLDSILYAGQLASRTSPEMFELDEQTYAIRCTYLVLDRLEYDVRKQALLEYFKSTTDIAFAIHLAASLETDAIADWSPYNAALDDRLVPHLFSDSDSREFIEMVLHRLRTEFSSPLELFEAVGRRIAELLYRWRDWTGSLDEPREYVSRLLSEDK